MLRCQVSALPLWRCPRCLSHTQISQVCLSVPRGLDQLYLGFFFPYGLLKVVTSGDVVSFR